MVESSKLELLTKHSDNYHLDDKDYIENVITPKLQTDFFIEEVSNLQLEHMSNGRLGIKQITKRVDKDKFSAVSYGLYYIMKYENNVFQKKDPVDINQLLSTFKKPSLRSY